MSILKKSLLDQFNQEIIDNIDKYEFESNYMDYTPESKIITDISNSFSILKDKNNTKVTVNDQYINVYSYDKILDVSFLINILSNLLFTVTQSSTRSFKLDDKKMQVFEFEVLFQGSEKELQSSNISDFINDIINGKYQSLKINALAMKGLSPKHIFILLAYSNYLFQLKNNITNDHSFNFLIKYKDFSIAFINEFYKKLLGQTQNIIPSKYDDNISFYDLYESINFSSNNELYIAQSITNLLKSTIKTNIHLEKDFISLKFKCDIQDLYSYRPPYREIFVFSNYMQGVHIRFGKISRGGLRWSDRSDYRREIFDLVKAQRIKNSVIIPDGAKGGFLITKESYKYDDVKKIYQIFISALLDVTDNTKNKEDDSYLVVAADKGTASFSDLANEVANKYNFWLNDAFASGSSFGYSHKDMGITAKGVWESVKQHFFEININPEVDTITAIGVGSMAGDVFGNGLLLSKTVKLLAAYSGRYLFIDPNPDLEKSYNERKRLFDECLEWHYYNPEVLSKGAIIADVSNNSIELTKEAAELLGLNISSNNKVKTQNVLIAIWKMQVDLIWFGGIGTYIKSSQESNVEVGDSYNDNIRINGNEIRAKVIAEGANLALTQKGRIEACQSGVLLNTDFIDNAAGVNTSDHEVNIKIALKNMIDENIIDENQKVSLFRDMQDSIEDIVKYQNRLQSINISMESCDLNMYNINILLKELSNAHIISIKNDNLPSYYDLRVRRAMNQNILLRPEICVIYSSAKLFMYSLIHECNIKDMDAYITRLIEYFPQQISNNQVLIDSLQSHSLGDRIVYKTLANEIIDTCGMTMPIKLLSKDQYNPDSFIKAYICLSELFKIRQTYISLSNIDQNKLEWNYISESLSQIRSFVGIHIYHVYNLFEQGIDVFANMQHYTESIELISKSFHNFDEIDRLNHEYNTECQDYKNEYNEVFNRINGCKYINHVHVCYLLQNIERDKFEQIIDDIQIFYKLSKINNIFKALYEIQFTHIHHIEAKYIIINKLKDLEKDMITYISKLSLAGKFNKSMFNEIISGINLHLSGSDIYYMIILEEEMRRLLKSFEKMCS